jgi:4-hydroxy-3-methylbut-2-enyl diphosphate reductase
MRMSNAVRLLLVNIEKVLLAYPRGFCAGVEKAIGALSWMVRLFEPPVYCYHEIVHNQVVVRTFESAGVIFVDDISSVPEGAPLMLSAHGTAPEVLAAAKLRSPVVIDAVCPLVTKVHHEIKTRAKQGYTIIYVGHKGHEEALGAIAEAPNSVYLVESESDLDGIEVGTQSVALLAQTTLAVPEWELIAEKARLKYPDLWMPNRSDLCYATTNRQLALTKLKGLVDALIVVGSANSSNTRALVRVAKSLGIESVYRVNGADELPDDLTGVIGVTAGASAAECIVRQIVERLAPEAGVEELKALQDEEEYFPPPPELRELTVGLQSALSLLTGRSVKLDLKAEAAAQALEIIGALPTH